MNRAIEWRMSGLALLISAMMATTAPAQQPTVVLSIRGIEESLDDLELIGAEIGKEGLKEANEGQLLAVTGGKGLAGIDRKKPLGIYWNAGEGTNLPVVFLPVSDADALKGLLKDLTPDFNDSNGQWSFTVFGSRVSSKMANGYWFASLTPASLVSLADPAKIANAKYDVALDVNLSGLPEPIKQSLVTQREAAWQQAKKEFPKAKSKSEEFARDFSFDVSQAVLKILINQGERITVGLDANGKTRQVAVDVAIASKPETDLSAAMLTFGKTIPTFSGLGAETAPLRLVLAYPTAGITEQLDKLIEGINDYVFEEIEACSLLTSDDDRAVAKGFATRVFDIAKATAKTGVMQSGLVVEPAADGKLQVVMGTKVAKGSDAAKVMDEILEQLKDEPRIAGVSLEAATHAGVRIHAVTPKFDDDNVEEILGDQPIHLAVRNDSFWITAGIDNLTALKKALDQFGKTPPRAVAPISLRTRPAVMVTSLAKDDDDLVARAKKVVGKPEDKLNLEIVPIAGGAKLRLELGFNVLGLLPQDNDH